MLRISDQHADRSDMVNVERPVYLVDNGAKIPILKLPKTANHDSRLVDTGSVKKPVYVSLDPISSFIERNHKASLAIRAHDKQWLCICIQYQF